MHSKKIMKHIMLIGLLCSTSLLFSQAGFTIKAKEDGGSDPRHCISGTTINIDVVGYCGYDPFVTNGCLDMYLIAVADGNQFLTLPITLSQNGVACQVPYCNFTATITLTPAHFPDMQCGESILVRFDIVNQNGGTYDFTCLDLNACPTRSGLTNTPNSNSFSLYKCCDDDSGTDHAVIDPILNPPTRILPWRSAPSVNNTNTFYSSINNTLNLKVISREAAEIPVQIYSLNGQKVHDQKVAITNGLNEVEISLNQLNDGLYISHMMIDGKAEVIKFSVNK